MKAGAKVVSKKAVQQAFYTPPEVAARFLDRVRSFTFLDGLNVLEPSAGAGALVKELLNRGAKVRAMDNDPDAIEELLKISSDRLAVVLDDFLTYKPSRYEVYDIVVMNPPFTKGQDALHVMKALQMINSTGSVFAIMPSGWAKDRGPHKELQALAEYEILEELDSGAFKESGTMVATQIVRFGRRK